jgi:hypothetical protein
VRSDVHQVISERPKSGRGWESKTPRAKSIELDILGDQCDEASNHINRRHQKYRAARFNVVERFLVNRIGKHWDKVYAEVCKVADPRSFHGAEVRNGVKRLVETECWLNGRVAMGYDWRGCPTPVRGFYVHPKSRLLLRQE